MKKSILLALASIIGALALSSCDKELAGNFKLSGEWGYVETNWHFNGEVETSADDENLGITILFQGGSVTQFTNGQVDYTVPYTVKDGKLIIVAAVMTIEKLTSKEMHLSSEEEPQKHFAANEISRERLVRYGEYKGKDIYEYGDSLLYERDGTYYVCEEDFSSGRFYDKYVVKCKKIK